MQHKSTDRQTEEGAKNVNFSEAAHLCRQHSVIAEPDVAQLLDLIDLLEAELLQLVVAELGQLVIAELVITQLLGQGQADQGGQHQAVVGSHTLNVKQVKKEIICT